MSILLLLGPAFVALVWFCPDFSDWCARMLHTRAAGLRAARQAQGHVWEIWRGLEKRKNGRG